MSPAPGVRRQPGCLQGLGRQILVLLWLVSFLPCAHPPALAAEEDPYAAWRQGRPQDAAAELLARALADGRWTTWYDAGLAARAAGDAGAATACLLAAHRRAPARPEPLLELRRHGARIGLTWCEALGPLALAGSGWAAALIALAGGGLSGLALARRLGPGWGWGGAAALALILVGAAAQWRDAQAPFAGVVRPSALLDGRGASLVLLPEGSLVRTQAPAWQGRRLVELGDGQLGFVAVSDLADGR